MPTADDIQCLRLEMSELRAMIKATRWLLTTMLSVAVLCGSIFVWHLYQPFHSGTIAQIELVRAALDSKDQKREDEAKTLVKDVYGLVKQVEAIQRRQSELIEAMNRAQAVAATK